MSMGGEISSAGLEQIKEKEIVTNHLARAPRNAHGVGLGFVSCYVKRKHAPQGTMQCWVRMAQRGITVALGLCLAI